MINFKFNPINQVVVYLDACAPARVSLYRCDDTTVTSVIMTNHLRQLIRTAQERGQLCIEGQDTNYDEAPNLTLVYYMPEYVLDGFIAQYQDLDWSYLKQLTTVEEVMDELIACGQEDVTEFESAQYVGMYAPIDSMEDGGEETAVTHPHNHRDVNVLTIVHGRLSITNVIPFNVNGKLAAANLF